MPTGPSFIPSRRGFIKAATLAAAATGLPNWFIQESLAQAADAAAGRSTSPNEKPHILLIGCGGQGRGDAKGATRFANVVAVCDVDKHHAADAAAEHPGAKVYHDFRKALEHPGVDAVIDGCPDHWHTLVNIAAMRAGKDVYGEKPLTLTIDEGKHVVTVAKETGRILQTGTQQRSEDRFRLACELVRSGRVGKLKNIIVTLPAGRREGPFKPQPVPEYFDWDMWQGPTGPVDYVKERTHLTFRYWWDYSGGTMTDWGAHHNDIALWAMGLDRSGPTEIEGRPLVEMIPGGFTAASLYEVNYKYANGVTHTCTSTTANTWSGGEVKDPPDPKDKGRFHGVRFEGSDGWIFVTRGKIEASDPQLLKQELPAGAERLYVSRNHMGNFIDCIKSRKETVAPPEVGHRSASCCHLGVLAIRLGRKLKWDPQKEQFIGDDEAQSYVARKQRKPWSYETV
jgi:predicted dehydrogenase